MPKLTAERLHKVLAYDPATGEFTWLAKRHNGKRAGWLEGDGHRRIGVENAVYLSARLAVLWMTGRWPTKLVDHHNLDKSDDRWSNLREATFSQNGANRSAFSSKTVPLKGVRMAGNRYRAAICIEGKMTDLGCFTTPEAAHARYCEAAAEHFGEFARTA
jgi:HNH endonuclease